MPTCPACAESILDGIEKCPHCGSSIFESAHEKPQPRTKKKSLLVIALVVTGLLVVCACIPVSLILPAVSSARKAGQRTQCLNNVRSITLALHNYASNWGGSLPPAYVADANGKPMHSWRVLILPYLDQQALYEEYDFTETWDGPKNSRLLDRMPAVFSCPSHSSAPGSNRTAYAGVFGEHCVFRGSQSVTLDHISLRDGLGNTIMLAEASHAAIPWTKPQDVDVNLHPALGDKQGFSSDHSGIVVVGFADGRVRSLSLEISAQTLRALFTCDGGEEVGANSY